MKRDPISPYFDIKTDAEGQEYMEVYLEGIALLRLVLSNKGTAFTEDERVALGLSLIHIFSCPNSGTSWIQKSSFVISL